MDPYEVRRQAEVIIGEDRVPTDVLQEIVDLYGPPMAYAETVRVVTENLARLFNVDASSIEEDHNGPPGGTSDYNGRSLAFTLEVDGRDLRVLVEDVTIDSEKG